MRASDRDGERTSGQVAVMLSRGIEEFQHAIPVGVRIDEAVGKGIGVLWSVPIRTNCETGPQRCACG